MLVNKSISETFGFDLDVDEFKIRSYISNKMPQCYKINTLVTPKTKNQRIDFHSFGLEISFTFNQALFDSMPTDIASVTLTSEENAYGWKLKMDGLMEMLKSLICLIPS